MNIASTPPPPYYAVIFTSVRREGDEGYAKMSERMAELAREQPGYLGFESARQEIGISVSYWKDLESIRNWKQNIEHLEAQRLGRSTWYESFMVRIARVEKAYVM